MEYRKTHSAPKTMLSQGPELSAIVDDTMKRISDLVGSTLGPGGQPVLLERSDDLPPIVTKDGVTVFKNLGFQDPMRQAILESYREAAVHTANSAGDGTTTCAILSEALGRLTRKFCLDNPGYSPHRVVREMNEAFKTIIEPTLRKLAIKATLGDEAGKRILRQVALISANGDPELADSVMECYSICGDEGNVTLVEASGNSRYQVEEIQGYPLNQGYDESCGIFYSKFLREPALHRTVLKRPLWILYFGQITEFSKIERIFETIYNREGNWGRQDGERDVVLVATYFSESVLGQLATNWRHPGQHLDSGEFARPARVFPLRAPRTAIQGSERSFLDDLAAVTGAQVYDDIDNQLETVTYEGLGAIEHGEIPSWRGRTETFEVYRTRSFVMGFADPDLIELRTAELRAALQSSESKLETSYLSERIARLGGGIARLTVFGSTNGETKEKRDRAEDAICAVRGALMHGALYGGCWGLIQAADQLTRLSERNPSKANRIPNPLSDVLAEAMLEPFRRLLSNVGILTRGEQDDILWSILNGRKNGAPPLKSGDATVVFDALQLKLVNPIEAGIYDSVPSVLESLRSALSIAGVMGTLGGIVAFARDGDLERLEASSVNSHEREVKNWYNADHEDGALLPGE